jgi:hypothetical protein
LGRAFAVLGTPIASLGKAFAVLGRAIAALGTSFSRLIFEMASRNKN